jgi:hypothetical protein
MSNRFKTVLQAATPVVAIVLLAVGARLQPSALGDTTTTPNPQSAAASHVSRAGDAQQRNEPQSVAADQATQVALQRVVTAQLDAFAHNDFKAALRYSSPTMHGWTPQLFESVVAANFAPLLSYRKAYFAPARITGLGAIAVLPVSIMTSDGQDVSYLYMLHKVTVVTNVSSAPNAAPGSHLASRNVSGAKAKPYATDASKSGHWFVQGVQPLGSGEETPRMMGPSDRPDHHVAILEA